MDSKYATASFFTTNKRYFPNDSIGIILKSLENLNDQNVSILMSSCKFHSPTASILFSIFLGFLGIDRFRIGNIGKGISKLTSLCLGIFFIISHVSTDNDNYILLILGLLSLASCVIQWLIDIFCIIAATKNENIEILASNIEDYFEKDVFKNYFERKTLGYLESKGWFKDIFSQPEKITKLEDELKAAKQNASNLEMKLRDSQKRATDTDVKLKEHQKKVADLENGLKKANNSTIEIAKKMKADGIENKWIAETTGLSIQEIEKLTI